MLVTSDAWIFFLLSPLQKYLKFSPVVKIGPFWSKNTRHLEGFSRYLDIFLWSFRTFLRVFGKTLGWFFVIFREGPGTSQTSEYWRDFKDAVLQCIPKELRKFTFFLNKQKQQHPSASVSFLGKSPFSRINKFYVSGIIAAKAAVSQTNANSEI